MRPEDVLAKVCGVASAEITDETSNSNLEEWDSLAHVILVMELENEYGVKLSVDEAIALKDVAQIKLLLRDRGVTW